MEMLTKIFIASLNIVIFITFVFSFAIAETSIKPSSSISTDQPQIMDLTAFQLFGACILRGNDLIQIPNYNAPEIGTGYVMKKMGTVKNFDEIVQKCTDAIFLQLMSQYCQSNSNPAMWQVATYNKMGNRTQISCAQSGCYLHACGTSVSGPPTFFGACYVRDGSIGVPGYYSPEIGTGWAMKKMGTVKNYDEIVQKCTDAIFLQLMSQYCQNNSNPAQLSQAIFDSLGLVKASGCTQSNCNDHQCP
jgi:hypothetical protein